MSSLQVSSYRLPYSKLADASEGQEEIEAAEMSIQEIARKLGTRIKELIVAPICRFWGHPLLPVRAFSRSSASQTCLETISSGLFQILSNY